MKSLTQAQLDDWVSLAKKRVKSGQIPNYIPHLAAVMDDWVAVCAQFADRDRIAAGQIEQSFALMSVIKPFMLLFLLEQLGQEAVFAQVGIQPSEQPFHSLAQLAADHGFPRNPMINSGAIALADRIPGGDGTTRCKALCQWLNQQSGARLFLDEAMLVSVRSVGNETNRAIAAHLAQAGYLNTVDAALDTYNQICCLSGTVTDLAQVGLLLACPHPAIAPHHQRIVNALMLTCGLYEASGTAAVQIGLPIKSGVSGALLAIVPRQGAIACYSPTLDPTGSSVAGLFLLEQIAQSLNLSIFG